jgi:hypothetical protein
MVIGPDSSEFRQAVAGLVRSETLTKLGSPTCGESSIVEYQKLALSDPLASLPIVLIGSIIWSRQYSGAAPHLTELNNANARPPVGSADGAAACDASISFCNAGRERFTYCPSRFDKHVSSLPTL